MSLVKSVHAMPSLFQAKSVSRQVFVCLDYVCILDHFVNKLHLGSHYSRLQWTESLQTHDELNHLLMITASATVRALIICYFLLVIHYHMGTGDHFRFLYYFLCWIVY